MASGEIANMLKVNKVVNPGFEEDSPETNTHVAWKTSGDEDASYTTGWNLTNLPNSEDLQLQSRAVHAGASAAFGQISARPPRR